MTSRPRSTANRTQEIDEARRRPATAGLRRAGTEGPFYLPMTNVPESALLLYLASPAGKVALSGYDPDFCVSLRFTETCPLASVVPVAVCVPRTKVTFLPLTGCAYSSSRLAVSAMIFDGPPDSTPV